MRNLVLFLIVAGITVFSACQKKESEKFKLLTGPTWQADSLLANGVDASGPGGVLSKFGGEAKFNTDGTGTFGQYAGTWQFNNNENEIIITSDSILIPITAVIKELTSVSLKLTTSLITPTPPYTALNIRMTFKAK
jgi:hypothetical protein